MMNVDSPNITTRSTPQPSPMLLVTWTAAGAVLLLCGAWLVVFESRVRLMWLGLGTWACGLAVAIDGVAAVGYRRQSAANRALLWLLVAGAGFTTVFALFLVGAVRQIEETAAHIRWSDIRLLVALVGATVCYGARDQMVGWRDRLRRYERRRFVCHGCGYDLAGTLAAGRRDCPECGRPVDEPVVHGFNAE